MGWVLFFDGECGFCSKSVQIVARLDREQRVSFAPLQGRLAGEHGFTKHLVETGGTMVVLRESDGSVFTKSDGLIELSRALGGIWRIFTLARLVPRILRDGAYRWVARHRYRLMGKVKSCSLPSPELLKRLRD
jgi:predicted DCC family thiol-disulfide oxidoreductase YuxK